MGRFAIIITVLASSVLVVTVGQIAESNRAYGKTRALSIDGGRNGASDGFIQGMSARWRVRGHR